MRSPSYPMLTRFRLRRLLAFLRSHHFASAFQDVQSQFRVFLDLGYVQRFLEVCFWDDANTYLLRFVPYDDMGVQGRILHNFIVHLRVMHTIASRGPLASQMIAKFERCCTDPQFMGNPDYVKVMRTILSMASDQVRTSVDWYLVGKKTAEIARDLITRAPEYSEFLRLPRRSTNIHSVVNVLPRGFGSRRFCRVKKAARVPGSDIAKYFLPKERLLPAGHGMRCSGMSYSGLSLDSTARLRAIIDEALQAGTCTALHQEHPVQYAYNEGMLWKKIVDK
uniref:Uncharacterized protein n=1 Tax=Arundo donax TaxID=35708 RepID=A0A0A9DIV9_ARUDO